MDWHGRFVHDLTKPVGMKQNFVSMEKQKAWGWNPKIRINEGIAGTYEYYLKNYRS